MSDSDPVEQRVYGSVLIEGSFETELLTGRYRLRRHGPLGDFVLQGLYEITTHIGLNVSMHREWRDMPTVISSRTVEAYEPLTDTSEE